jgi:hypothetical protein
MKYTTDKMMLRHERHFLQLLDEKLEGINELCQSTLINDGFLRGAR